MKACLFARYVTRLAIVALLGLMGRPVLAQAPVISSFSCDGELVCTNLPPGTEAAVEWAGAVEGPWNNSWAGLDSITVDSTGTIRVSVPMFYRVRGEPASPTNPNPPRLVVLGLTGSPMAGQAPAAPSFGSNGELVCTNLPPGSEAVVEWACSVEGPWNNSWAGLDSVTVDSSGTIRVHVPMCYRVRSEPGSPPNPDPARLVWIEPGTFMMGSPTSEALRWADEPQHEVTISQGFWMAKYEVTQGEFLEVTGGNPSYFTNGVPPTSEYGGMGGPVTNGLLHPVEWVSWSEMTNYCGLLTEQERAAERLPTGCIYRLPTEAEWEYACRAGTTTAFCYGDELRSGMVNFDGQSEYDASAGAIPNPEGLYIGRTTEVGSYEPNAWGLYDMHGNVWERCQDLYGPYPVEPVTDPQGYELGSVHVVRGGVWLTPGSRCRSAHRYYDHEPEGAHSTVGFRVVLAKALLITLQPQDQAAPPGEDVTFSVKAKGYGPLTYQWKYNQTELPGATDSTLTISNAQLSDEGSYSVVVSDSQDSIASASATLTILIPPTIVEQPQDLTVNVGQNATFSVTITGHPPPFGYEWRKGSVPLVSNTLYQTTSTFTLTNVQIGDAGRYRVVIENAAHPSPGVASRLAILTVEE